MSRLFFALILLGLSLPLWAEPPVSAQAPWVRESPPGTATTAAYMTLHNQGEEAVQLSGVTVDEYKRAELHESIHEDGRARMQALASITIPAGGQVTLAPGGKHIMLFEPQRRLEAGDWVTLTLRFDNRQLLQITAPVRQRTGREEADQAGGHDHE